MNRRTRLSWALAFCSAANLLLLVGAQSGRAADPPAGKPTQTNPAAEHADADHEAEPKLAVDAAAERRDEKEFYELYRSLADTVDQVDRNYVKKVDRRELMEAAIKGILSKLDPYSNYIGPEDAGRFKDTVENQFGGIGIQVASDDGQLKVISPLVGAPAYKAGVQAGDRILKIGDEATAGMSLDDAVHKLKGDIGTSVKLTIVHAGERKTQVVTVPREVVHLDTVLGDRRKSNDHWDFMLDHEKRIGYIRVTTFSRDTADDLKQALEELKAEKMRALILDLRFDPGGLLTAAVKTCDLFLTEGRIVSTEGRNSPKRIWDATKKSEAFTDFPMVVLINRYSASASEITSACLQDHGRAIIIGERSWGKGSVQNVIELEDGKSLLKLTTASYLRPNGHNIHRFPDSKETDEWGVKPNPGFEVRLSDAEMAELMVDRRDRDIVLPQHHGDHDPKDDKTGGDSSKDSKAHKEGNDRSRPAFVDRQLNKATEYLAKELSKAK